MSLRAESAIIEFWIILETKLCVVSMSSDSEILDIFEYLKDKYTHILGGISDDQGKFYKLKNPMSLLEIMVNADLIKDVGFPDQAAIVAASLHKLIQVQ